MKLPFLSNTINLLEYKQGATAMFCRFVINLTKNNFLDHNRTYRDL